MLHADSCVESTRNRVGWTLNRFILFFFMSCDKIGKVAYRIIF